MSYIDTLAKFDELNADLGILPCPALDCDGEACVKWMDTAKSVCDGQTPWLTWWPASGRWSNWRHEYGTTTDPWSASYQALAARLVRLAPLWNLRPLRIEIVDPGAR